MEKEIQELLAKARDVDQKEDELYGKDKDAHPIEEELLRRERRLEIIRKAKAELEEEARQAKAEDLRERAARQREAAATEENPIRSPYHRNLPISAITPPVSRIRKANPVGDCAEETLGESPAGSSIALIEGLFGASP